MPSIPFENDVPDGGPPGPSDDEMRLRALNHSKDKLLSIVSHDLRTAIGGAVSLVDMVEKRLEDGDVAEAKRLNGLVRRAALDADDLLRDLVGWTRSHGQALEFHLERLDVGELIQLEVDRARAAAERKDQRIRVELRNEGVLRGDRYMLQGILRNLISNALKFSNTGGEVVVRARRHPGQWDFQVCDEGIGMDDAVQASLLKIDTGKERAGTAGEAGSGFGLLLCEEFVQRHGGQLYWRSKPGEGSTFGFTIPELLG